MPNQPKQRRDFLLEDVFLHAVSCAIPEVSGGQHETLNALVNSQHCQASLTK